MSKKEKKSAQEPAEETVEPIDGVETAAEETVPETPDSPGADETAALKEQLAAQEDRFLRLCAEYDNFRRRSQKEKEGIYQDATADAVKAMLPV